MKIKICGITGPADAVMVAEAGADWVGLNFHPASPRAIGEETARAILAALPAAVEAVGVFVNRPPAEVAAMAARVGLHIVQLHGNEPVEDLLSLGDLRIVKAFRVGDAADLAAIVAYAHLAADRGRPLEAVLLDASVPGHFGGTGRAIADGLLDLLRPLVPALPPLILAGGLTPENVGDRIARVWPWMVDVAGGVETAPGRKDVDRVGAFLQAARSQSYHHEGLTD